MTSAGSRWLRSGLVVCCLCAIALTLWLGVRSYRSWLLLRSAYALAAPDLANIRGWMTVDYLTRLYGIAQPDLLQRLGLPPETSSATTLRSLAQQSGVAPFTYVQRVQGALAATPGPASKMAAGDEGHGWLGQLNDGLLTALLLYGYPALGVVLAVASLGLPLPSGLLTAAAGSLIAQDKMGWLPAGAVAVVTTVIGDMAGYALGRQLGGQLLERRGGWFGYTPARRRRAEYLFERWGWAGVVLSRTLVSSVSSVVNLVAGASRYRAAPFAGAALVGRILWTSAYLGLGYGVSGALEAANGFLSNLTGLLFALALVIASIWLLARRSK